MLVLLLSIACCLSSYPGRVCTRALIDGGDDVLLLDVQDPGSDMIPGSYSASLGTLVFKASTDLAEFKDPKIADRAKDALIIVNCGLGGQAKLGAKLL